MYLGVKVVLAKSIERIHFANLINFAIVPMIFENPADYDTFAQDDAVAIRDLMQAVTCGATTITVENTTKKTSIVAKLDLSERQRKILAAGGLLRWVKSAK